MRGEAIPFSTSRVPPTDRAIVEEILARDPVSNAVVWNRAFDMEGEREIYTEDEPPKGVLAVAHPGWAEGAAGVAMQAEDPRVASRLMEHWPHGPVFLHLTEEWMLPLVEARSGKVDGGVFWLWERDTRNPPKRDPTEVRPLDPRWAERIGKVWDPGWDGAAGYVRRRIEAGHAYAVEVDGEPVAWALTHFETPRVSMMGFLHVLEPHRRKGYAKAVSLALVQDILDRGKIPALHVKTDNVASLELTASLGFHRVKKQVWAEAILR